MNNYIMKHLFKAFLSVLVCSFFLISCQKDQVREQSKNGITSEVIGQIKALGFSTNDVKRVENGYVVEGDIFLSDKSLTAKNNGRNLVIAKSEQYKTWNIIAASGHRVITVSVTNLPAAYTTATDEAIARYNALGLRISFQRVASGGEIDIINANLGSGVLGQSAGFPDAAGNPPSPIKLNASYIGSNPNQGWMATIIAHEIGHTIGFRHTDYFNRAYSCGIGGNEGDAGVGADHIPGTPTAADPNSFMLACIGTGVNRPFNANDVVALNYLYGGSVGTNPIPDGIYRITSAASGKVLDVDAGTIGNNGAIIQQWDWLSGDNQKWAFNYLGSGYYRITSVASGKVLDVDANTIGNNGAVVQQWDWLSGNNQQWIVRPETGGSFAIVSRASGKVLDIDAGNIGSNGARAQQWDWLNGANQRWFIQAP
ncbi:Ricin-type beta-trefoil lectin domain-like [Chitinophaga sp. YR627]|uniref:M57 family metalloprotease n=1 Tax=Chitinophaga sp. YR627 TaxID=1881041 RepID=UPI0008EF93B2|nr:M57 family metalloprotease [Chitinophaga sp. YR627]SFO45837.1 Ricin-type beta-trefoil lectin domain-like [Chitinophaga sp. YR627]